MRGSDCRSGINADQLAQLTVGSAARRGWGAPLALEEAIIDRAGEKKPRARDEFGSSARIHHQRLNAPLDRAEVLAEYPASTKRVRDRRTRRSPTADRTPPRGSPQLDLVCRSSRLASRTPTSA